jgi:hypothetical protein
MSIIRRGDLHTHVPPHSPHAGEAHSGPSFIELCIVIGIIVTLSVAIYVAVATEEQVMRVQRATQFES